MKTNVTCSLDSRLVANLDAWREPMGVGRSAALELLLESLPEHQVESPGDQVRLYFDSNGNQVERSGTHHENPALDMVVTASGAEPSISLPLLRPGESIDVVTQPSAAPASEPTAPQAPEPPPVALPPVEKKATAPSRPSPVGKKSP